MANLRRIRNLNQRWPQRKRGRFVGKISVAVSVEGGAVSSVCKRVRRSTLNAMGFQALLSDVYRQAFMGISCRPGQTISVSIQTRAKGEGHAAEHS